MGEWRADSEDRAERDPARADRDHARTSRRPWWRWRRSSTPGPIIYPGRRRRREQLEESLALTSRAVNLDPLDSRDASCRGPGRMPSPGRIPPRSAISTSRSISTRTIPGRSSRPRSASPSPASWTRRASLVAPGPRLRHALFPRRPGLRRHGALSLIGDYEAAVDAAEVAGDAIINLPAWQAASQIAPRRPPSARRGRWRRFLELARPDWIGDAEPARRGRDRLVHGLLPDPLRRGAAELRSRLVRGADRNKRGGWVEPAAQVVVREEANRTQRFAAEPGA